MGNLSKQKNAIWDNSHKIDFKNEAIVYRQASLSYKKYIGIVGHCNVTGSKSKNLPLTIQGVPKFNANRFFCSIAITSCQKQVKLLVIIHSN